MKIYYSYDAKSREGFETRLPEDISGLEELRGTIEEIAGEEVLEKVKDLIYFIDLCYALLIPGGKATFTAPYYTSFQAWQDPRNRRGISQASLNFANKAWREQNKFSLGYKGQADFEVQCNFAIDLVATQRSEDAKAFWLNRYNNIVQSTLFVLEKKE